MRCDMMEEIDDLYEPYIQTLDDVSTKHRNRNTCFGFILYSIVSIIFLWTYEIAGIIAIYGESNEFIIPKIVRYKGRGGDAFETVKYLMLAFCYGTQIFIFSTKEVKADFSTVNPRVNFLCSGIICIFSFFVQWQSPEEITTGTGQLQFTFIRSGLLLIYNLIMIYITAYPYYTQQPLVQSPISFTKKSVWFFLFVYLLILRYLPYLTLVV